MSSSLNHYENRNNKINYRTNKLLETQRICGYNLLKLPLDSFY
jgi:hypothetical protein